MQYRCNDYEAALGCSPEHGEPIKIRTKQKKNNKETKRKNVREASLSLIWPKVVEVTVAWPRVKVPQVVSIESAGRERSSETNPVV